jgi:hypothetical protein
MILKKRHSASDTLTYLKILYAGCLPDYGEIVLVDKTKCRPIGIYRFDELERLATDIQRNAGCFLKINPMDSGKMAERQAEKIRTQGYGWTVGNIPEVKSIIGFHLDVDAAKSDKYLSRDQALEALAAMPIPPTMVVNTDGIGAGFHAYWLLQVPIRITSDAVRKYWIALAKRWQERLKSLALEIGGKEIDSTANIDRVLRPVGSLRDSGNRVSIHSFSEQFYFDNELYIEPTIDEIQADAQQSVKKLFDNVLGPIRHTGRPIDDYIEAAYITPETLLAEAGYTQLRDPLEWRRPGAANPGRSLKIANKLDTLGINVFSGGDPLFSCMKQDGSVGKFHSVKEMFVIIRHGGDWKAASKWCRQQIGDSLRATVDIGGITNG